MIEDKLREIIDNVHHYQDSEEGYELHSDDVRKAVVQAYTQGYCTALQEVKKGIDRAPHIPGWNDDKYDGYVKMKNFVMAIINNLTQK